MSDQTVDGRRIRILTIIDTFTRLALATDLRHSYRGPDVVDTLERVTAEYGKPKSIRVDQGPEFVSKALDLWAYLNGVTWTSPGLGSPPITPSLSRSMDRSGLSVSMPPGF